MSIAAVIVQNHVCVTFFLHKTGMVYAVHLEATRLAVHWKSDGPLQTELHEQAAEIAVPTLQQHKYRMHQTARNGYGRCRSGSAIGTT